MSGVELGREERGGGRREKAEGGRSNKRKHRAVSISDEDDHVHRFATPHPSTSHR